jgi:Ser/Thr protein kinase RdoA (MazF antagonist)
MDHKLGQLITQEWGLTVSDLTLFAERENKTYRLEAPEGFYAVKVARAGYHEEQALWSELMFLDMLAGQGAHVVQPLSTKSGAFLVPFEGQFVSISNWLVGETLAEDVTPDQYTALGVALARLHDLADGWQAPEAFVRPSWDLDGLLGEAPFWDRFWLNTVLTESEQKICTDFRKNARAALSELDLDFGLIHADAARENVMVHKGNVLLLDFDDFGFGYRIFDLTTAILKTDHLDNHAELVSGLIAGYRSVRDIDLSELTLFMALRACTYLGWIMSRSELDANQERSLRAKTFALKYIALWPGNVPQTQG